VKIARGLGQQVRLVLGAHVENLDNSFEVV